MYCVSGIQLFLLAFFFFFNDPATTEIYTVYNTLSLHDALPIRLAWTMRWRARHSRPRASRVRSEEHTSELQSLYTISYAVFCLKKKKTQPSNLHNKSLTKKKKKNKNIKHI